MSITFLWAELFDPKLFHPKLASQNESPLLKQCDKKVQKLSQEEQ